MTNPVSSPRPGFPATPRAGSPAAADILPRRVAAVLPAAILVMVLAADVAHLVTTAALWAQAAAWLLLAVLAAGLPAVVFAIARLLAESSGTSPILCIGPVVGDTVLLGLVASNYLLRTGGSPAQDMPYGLGLSMTGILLALLTRRFGDELVFRRGVGLMRRREDDVAG